MDRRRKGKYALWTLLAWMLFAAASLLALGRMHASVRLPIIMYHSIDEVSGSVWSLTAQALEEDLRYLRDNGYETVLPRDLAAYADGTGTLPEKPVMLTFDDGYANNLTAALPLLERYQMDAVVSIIGVFMREPTPGVQPRDSGPMDWEQVAALAASPHIELACHTWDLHRAVEGGRQGCMRLENESVDEYAALFTADIRKFQVKLSAVCGTEALCFTYPHGSVCPEARQLVPALGFRVSMTTDEGCNGLQRGGHFLYGLLRYNRAPERPVQQILEQIASEYGA